MKNKKSALFLVILFFIAILAALVFNNDFPWKNKKPGLNDLSRKDDRPNVLFILLDAARADHFSCYGYDKNTTPNIDAISRDGATFLNFFTNDTATMASLPKIFSSRYFSLPVFGYDSWMWGIIQSYPYLIFKDFDDRQIFLPEALSLKGYQTALFTNNTLIAKESYFAQKFDKVFTFGLKNEDIVPPLLCWLEKNRKRKFFVYCHITSPHSPYWPKEEDKKFLKGADPLLVDVVREKALNPKSYLADGWTEEEFKILRGLYDSNLKNIDKWIGRLYETLGKLDLRENTLIIISSDHGESLGEQNSVGHIGLPYDSLIKVPLIMVYPPLIPGGVKVSGLTESIDIMPGILDICGIDLPRGKAMDGTSLLKSINDPETGKEAVFTRCSIRTPGHKYIIDHKEEEKELFYLQSSLVEQLYDLKKDPAENNNIAEQNRPLAEEFKNRFHSTMKPFLERCTGSLRKGPPDFPFYYRINVFDITPKYRFQHYGGHGSKDVFLKKAAPVKPWLLDIIQGTYGIFCLPENGIPGPITLSAGLPNADYRVYLLLDTEEDISSVSLGELGLRYRFDKGGPFVLPKGIDSALSKTNFYYLDLGPVSVKDEKFAVEIDFQPPNKGVFAIRHVKFLPIIDSIPVPHKPLSKAEVKRREEELKALGYLAP